MTATSTDGARLVRALLAAMLLASTAFACGGAQSGGAREGSRARDFALPDTRGRTVRLSDYLGKDVILLSFWATWCVPCKDEHPHLQRMYEAYRDQGFVILCISMDDPESVAEVAPHARRYGLTFPMLLDQETRVVGILNPKKAAPYSVLIGRDGKVAYTHEGYSPGDEMTLEKEIKKQLAVEKSGG